MTGGATYYTAVSYVVDGIPGDRLVEGPATVGTLAANPPTSTLTAGEAMTPRAQTIGRDTLAVEALRIMETHKITSVVVVDAGRTAWREGPRVG